MSDLTDKTATELLALYASGQASPVEAVQDCFARIAAVDPALNAVLTPLQEQALASAADSADRWVKGTARPLEGVPYGLKDIVATAGIRTTGGSRLYEDHVPTADATLAARLRNAGGVLVAKLHTFEFACGGAQNRTFGECRNPWDLTRTTGGSSSGSGAAVAARMMPVAIGTDTGGSIRIPSSYCGLTGLKPTYGRVPRDGVMGMSWTMDHAGPMTRSAADAALVLDVIAGASPGDPTSSARPVPDHFAAVGASVAGRRVGRPRGWFEDRMHPAVGAAFEAALAQLEGTGVEVVDVELEEIDVIATASWAVIYAEMLSLHADVAHLVEDRDSMGAGLLAATPYVHAADYLKALRYRAVFQQQLDAVMSAAGIDAFVTPAATTTPPRLADMLVDTGDGLVDWLDVASRVTVPFNYSGSPALVMPGALVDGMPTSIQLAGRPHQESTLLSLAGAFQSVTAHHLARPAEAPLHTPAPTTVGATS
ncbi:amidase [Kineococcus sp. SYSU DK003]|uniref:amidase n=1 Tax=Kineococcus sp. SYSU DK003 TaxID=3383124 RepID=UPI003D7D9BD4